jgi:putative membrane protein
MMHWYGGGMGTGAWLFMGLFWLALIALIVWLVARILPGGSPGNASGPGSPGNPESAARESALDILDRRFAQGEMDIDTYKAQRAALVEAKEGRR